jgi:hypothetical protein
VCVLLHVDIGLSSECASPGRSLVECSAMSSVIAWSICRVELSAGLALGHARGEFVVGEACRWRDKVGIEIKLQQHR